MASLQREKLQNEYMSLSDLGSMEVTHQTIEDKIEESTYDSANEIGPRLLKSTPKEDTMSAAIEKAKSQLAALEKSKLETMKKDVSQEGVGFETLKKNDLVAIEKRLLEETSRARVKVQKTKGISACIQLAKNVTFVDFAGCGINKKWVMESSQNEDLLVAFPFYILTIIYLCLSNRQNALLCQKYYEGVLTATQAEELCRTRTDWILYHRVPLSLQDASKSYSDLRDYPSTSQLYIVYRRHDTGAHE